MISAKPSKSIAAQTKVELKFPQLTLANKAHVGRYEAVSTIKLSEILNIIHQQKTQKRRKLSTKNNLQLEHGVSHLGWQTLSENTKKVCHGSTIKDLQQKPNTPQFLTWICCWPSWMVAIARNYKNSCCASSVKDRNLQWKPNTPKVGSILKLNIYICCQASWMAAIGRKENWLL